MRIIKTIIIEDDPMVLSINCKFLDRIDGFKVIATENSGQKGIDVIKNNECDLILLDIYLPEKNGLEVAKEIRNCDISADIIMITAATDSDIVVQSLRLGVVDYIIKPYNFARFSSSMIKYKNRFNRYNTNSFNQDVLDSITLQVIAEDTDKGIDKQTLEKIKGFVMKLNNSITAEELSNALSLSRVTARRYLEYLVKQGVLSCENELHKIGRPSKIYKFNI